MTDPSRQGLREAGSRSSGGVADQHRASAVAGKQAVLVKTTGGRKLHATPDRLRLLGQLCRATTPMSLAEIGAQGAAWSEGRTRPEARVAEIMSVLQSAALVERMGEARRRGTTWKVTALGRSWYEANRTLKVMWGSIGAQADLAEPASEDNDRDEVDSKHFVHRLRRQDEWAGGAINAAPVRSGVAHVQYVVARRSNGEGAPSSMPGSPVPVPVSSVFELGRVLGALVLTAVDAGPPNEDIAAQRAKGGTRDQDEADIYSAGVPLGVTTEEASAGRSAARKDKKSIPARGVAGKRMDSVLTPADLANRSTSRNGPTVGASLSA